MAKEFVRPYFDSRIFELMGGNPDQLDDPKYLSESFRGIFEELGIHIVRGPYTQKMHPEVHEFDPQGLSMITLFEESHAAAHTWPEEPYKCMRGFIEVCSPQVKLDQLPDLLGNFFHHEKIILLKPESLLRADQAYSPRIVTARLIPHDVTSELKHFPGNNEYYPPSPDLVPVLKSYDPHQGKE